MRHVCVLRSVPRHAEYEPRHAREGPSMSASEDATNRNERVGNVVRVMRQVMSDAGIPCGSTLAESCEHLELSWARDAHDVYARAFEQLAGEYRGHSR